MHHNHDSSFLNGSSQEVQQTIKKKDTEKRWWCRQDLWLWITGIIFMTTLVTVSMVWGEARQWDAPSGYTHNSSVTSQQRFLPEPYKQEYGVRGRYGPDATGRWYYWKLQPQLITVWTRLFPWAGYIGHQLVIWAIIYNTQQNKDKLANKNDRFSTKVDSFNSLALGLNMLFHVLHLLNTHITYDALAQDVSIASSQSSVVVILLFIILMEYSKRGLVLGWPSSEHTSRVSRFFALSSAPGDLVYKYHGYAFSWAAVFTFWYHPMENTLGHISGSFYTWMILLQGSLMYTEWHRNQYWRQVLEAWVILHGGIVAAQTGGPDMMGTRLWPMFTFGFAMVWVVTAIFSLSFWKYLPAMAKLIPLLLLMTIVTWAYSWIPDKHGRRWVRMPEVLRLPLTFYLYFMIAWLSGRIGFLIQTLLRAIGDLLNAGRKYSIAMLICGVLMYVVQILLAVLAEYGDLKMRLVALSLIFDAVFIFGCTLSFIFLDESNRVKAKVDDKK